MMANKVRFLVQDGPQAFYFVDGIGYHEGGALRSAGWRWVHGPDGGCWHAPSADEWRAARDRVASTPFYGGAYHYDTATGWVREG